MFEAGLLLVAVRAATLIAAGDAPPPMGLTVPKAAWVMRVPSAAFEMKQQQVKPDGTAAYFMMSDATTHLNLSFFIEPIKDCATAVACRDWAWKAEQTRLSGIEGVRQSEIGDAAVVEWLQPRLGKLQIDQKNMHAYWVKEGYWIDAHVSKVAYQESDRERFVELIRAIDFVPKSDVAPEPKSGDVPPPHGNPM